MMVDMLVLAHPVFLLASLLAAGPDQILGTWSPAPGESKIEITRCGSAYCGVLAWMRQPRNDEKNEDAALRARPLTGVQILTGARFDGAGWTGARLYAPERGKTVDARLSLAGAGQLEVKVSVGMMKRTVIWKRVQ
jgi:uncharacterized protein (DUF2147 family)